MSRLFVLGVLGLYAAALVAQSSDTATLRGHVTDPSHAAVAGATISATNAQTGAVRTTKTDASGNYTLAGLPVGGTYTLSASQGGAETASVPNLSLIGGASATVDLSLAPGTQSQVVTVTGTVGTVRADQPQLGDNLSAREIDEVPLLGNQITALPLLNSANRPSINMGDVFMNQFLITSNGTGRRQEVYAVDGVNSNDNWGRQTIFTAIPSSSVQEMSVLENGFSAEYGAGAGGVVNIVTKSGTSQWHGLAQYSVRPNGVAAHLSGFTSANATGGNDQTSDELQQGDWALSGPMGQHTQFAISGELTSRHRASPVISPLDPTNYVGIYHDGMIFGRLDHQFSSNHTLFARANGDSFYDTNPNGIVGGNNLPSVARVFSRRTYEAVLGDDYVLSPTLVNSARAQFQLADPITAFAPVNNATAFSVPISGFATFTSGTSQSAKLINRQYEAGDTLTGTWGRHSVKFGADVIYGRNGGNSKEFGGPNYLGTFTFPTCSSGAANGNATGAQLIAYCESPAFINIGNASSFTQSFGTANYEINDTIASGFVQDDFHVRPNLTVNLGSNYLRQTFTQSTKDFAPRLGFVYSPWSDTVVRGSYGLYFSPVVDNNEANYALTGPTGVANYTFTPGPCFPASLQGFSSVPNCGTTPLNRSLYLQPGRASYYNQFLPLSVLNPGYQYNGLENPYTEQWSFGVEHSFAKNYVLSADYIGSHSLRLLQPIDIDAPPAFNRTAQNQWRGVTNEPDGSQICNATGKAVTSASAASTCAVNAANAERPLVIYDTANHLPQNFLTVQTDINDGAAWYDALEVNFSHPLSHRLQTLVSYTWSHTLDTVDMDATQQNPNQATITGAAEKGNALWDQRHRLVISGVYNAPFQINFGGVATLASGPAYNITTGTTNDGDSADTSRPVVNGVVLARNAGRGTPTYSVDPFIERPFALTERVHLLVRAESFDVLNHANFVSFFGTYGNSAAPVTLGAPSAGVTAQLPAREVQFSARLTF